MRQKNILIVSSLSHFIIYNYSFDCVLTDIIVFAVLFVWRRRKSAGQGILLTGLSNTGKTLIYARLMCSKFVKTYTSVKENVGDITINNVSSIIYHIQDTSATGNYIYSFQTFVLEFFKNSGYPW